MGMLVEAFRRFAWRSSAADGDDLGVCIGLTMAARPRPAFLLFPKMHNPTVLVLGNDLGHDFGATDKGLSDLRRLPAEQEHILKRDVAADVARQLFDAKDVAFGDAILLTAV